MKYLISTIVIIGFMSSGCKKIYTCECTEFFNGTDTSWTKDRGSLELEYKKEEDASAACDAQDAETQNFVGNEYGMDCTLK